MTDENNPYISNLFVDSDVHSVILILDKCKARFRRRSTHVPNLTGELSTAKERRLNQFGTAVLVWCGKSVKFDRVCRTFVELNLGSTHGTPSESDVAPKSNLFS